MIVLASEQAPAPPVCGTEFALASSEVFARR